MTTHIQLNPLATHIPAPQQQILPAVHPLPNSAGVYQPPHPHPDVIETRPVSPSIGIDSLSKYLRLGRQFHPLCRQAFMEKRVIGYYHYERRIEVRTCAIAAAYVGAFGPEAIENPGFSYSMAIWRLSQRVGYDLNQLYVYGPTGRCQPVAQEMMQLVDEDLWTREGVAEWLKSLNL